MYDPVRLRDLETTYNGPIPGHLLSAARLPEGPLGQRLRREGALRFARWNLLITRDPRHQPRAAAGLLQAANAVLAGRLISNPLIGDQQVKGDQA
ncbi:MAG: hypothetical protein HOK61_02905 [Alphaproteobacteria bacterium]|jgi:hypothetical protein|nr:hypothetical protein [Alphaproteobacteria bacterium]